MCVCMCVSTWLHVCLCVCACLCVCNGGNSVYMFNVTGPLPFNSDLFSLNNCRRSSFKKPCWRLMALCNKTHSGVREDSVGPCVFITSISVLLCFWTNSKVTAALPAVNHIFIAQNKSVATMSCSIDASPLGCRPHKGLSMDTLFLHHFAPLNLHKFAFFFYQTKVTFIYLSWGILSTTYFKIGLFTLDLEPYLYLYLALSKIE